MSLYNEVYEATRRYNELVKTLTPRLEVLVM